MQSSPYLARHRSRSRAELEVLVQLTAPAMRRAVGSWPPGFHPIKLRMSRLVPLERFRRCLGSPGRGTIPGTFYYPSGGKAEELSMNGIIYIIG
jgi:hypothetical protein